MDTFLSKVLRRCASAPRVYWGIPNVREEGGKLGDDFLRAQVPEVTIVSFPRTCVSDVCSAFYSESNEFGRCLMQALPELADDEVDVWSLAGCVNYREQHAIIVDVGLPPGGCDCLFPGLDNQ